MLVSAIWPASYTICSYFVVSNSIYQSRPQNLLFITKSCITKLNPDIKFLRQPQLATPQYTSRNVAATKIFNFNFDLDCF